MFRLLPKYIDALGSGPTRCPVRRNQNLEVPVQLVLTRDGSAALSMYPTIRVSDEKGSLREGIRLESIPAPTLQKFWIHGYVEELQVESPQLLSHRRSLIGLTNLLIYGIFYRKLSPRLAEILTTTSVVQEYNRKYPKRAIRDYRTDIPTEALQQLTKKSRSSLHEMENDVRTRVILRIFRDPDDSEQDKEVKIKSIDKFLRWIDPRIWYLYYVVTHSEYQMEMEAEFANVVWHYLENTQLATHVSNLLMEFVQKAEKETLRRLAIRSSLSNFADLDMNLADSAFREKVRATAGPDDHPKVIWALSSTGSDNLRVKIIIRNRGIIPDHIRRKFNEKMKSGGGFSLAEIGSSGMEENLGLHYAAYVEEFCRSRDIYWFCQFHPNPQKEETSIMLELRV